MRFIDLSLPIKEQNPEELPESIRGTDMAPKVQYTDHIKGVEQMTNIFNCTRDDLPEGYGWATETVTLSTHSGTHLDAPYHYFPTSEGKPARTIDELPLEWFYGDGVVLDLRHKKSGEATTIEDLEQCLEKINYSIKPGDIVCLMYGKDKIHDKPEYWTDFPGMSAEATRWLIDKGVKVIATDAFGFDIPFEKMAENFAKTGDKNVIWPAHRVGREKEYCQIEKIANLDKLPPHGFKIVCFPISIHKASAGWVRPVAILED